MDPGTIVAERFIIERAAGSGAMGAIYRALDQQTGEPVALKVLLVDRPTFADRFVREARVLADLQHPRIVRYVAHGLTDDKKMFLAMEWLEGTDLEQHLAKHGISIADAVKLIASIAEALAVAHARGIVHRDLKPSNVYLPGGRLQDAKLLDFGIAHLGDGARSMTAAGMLLGTPGYMSPEQARGSDIDTRSDIFALGCVLFECVTGRWAFEAEHLAALLTKILVSNPPRLSELRTDVPPDLDALVDRMLSKDREKRPRDAAALHAEMAALAAIADSSARPRSVPPPSITVGERRLLSVVLVVLRGLDAVLDASRRRDTVESEPVEQAARETGADLGEALRRAAAPFGARVEQLANGGIVALMSGAGAATDQAVQAARCALAMRAAAPDAAMALATGRGEMGAPTSAEAIDRAADLLRGATLSAAETVLVDEVTASLLESRFVIAGTSSPRRLLGERDGEEGRRLLGQPTMMVGRDRDMTTLEALFAECVGESVARCVVLTGAAGVGKSRLRDEFICRVKVAHPEAEVFLVRGDPGSAGAPFALLAQLARIAFALQDGEPIEARREKVRARVARDRVDASDAPRVIEFLSEFVGAPVLEPSVPLRTARQDPLLMGDQLRRAWEDLFAAAAKRHAVVVVFEDLQWGDLPSVRFIDAALRSASDRSLFVLAIGRPELDQVFPKLWAARLPQTMWLGELPRKPAERLVRQVLGTTVDAEVVSRVIERAAGNAFYLEELIRAVSQGRGDELPESVLAMVQARIEALEADSRRVLRAASIFGRVFWADGVLTLLGGAKTTVRGFEQALADLQERELIVPHIASRFPNQREFAFRHEPVREAAYAMLTAQDGALGHRLAATWLEKSGETSATVLAEHFDRGGESARAVGWYLRAAEQALEGNDYRSTVERAGLGIKAGASDDALARLHLVAAEAMRWLGDLEGTEQQVTDALAVVRYGSERWFDAARLLVLSAGPNGHLASIIAIGEALCAAPLIDAGSLHVSTLLTASSQLRRIGRSDLADALRARVEGIAERLMDSNPTVTARMARTRALERGTVGDMQAMLEQQILSVRSFELAGDLRSAATIRPDVGYAYAELGLYEESEKVLRASLEDAQKFGLQHAVANALHNLGLTLARLGQLEEAERIEWDALRVLTTSGNRRMEGGARAYLAEILLLAGKLEGAEREARSAVETLVSHAPLKSLALAQLSRVLLARGERDEALSTAGEAMELLAHGVEAGDVMIRLARAEALVEVGLPDEARVVIRAAKEVLEARAANITRADWRVKFLTAIPEHARTFELANELK